ncbi:DUF2993 domain-containing protein [Corynebacterium sp. HS2168-gen11]|uniref:LmeA family phospholipid-binding protein n=1 Tax=Corynebacterium sp. HS2168-gen11 TaxID=2974027 RepID=UPI00216B03D8|nr:DUF2993 domain-containing protein [Corynebacterium sp. HS2168-gen11]MCS4536053.1 DUF2993 domain-containing protein [Corynebacterium sp. HS2168-gen11]
MAIGSLVTLLGLGWVGDTALAARSESLLANRVAAAYDLPVVPETYIGGFPFAENFFSHNIPDMYVSVTDVELPRWGLVRMHASLQDVAISRDGLFTGDIDRTRAALLTTGVSLDAVSVGKQLGMTDLDIAHPYDISPKGGAASEVRLTGTPANTSKPISVIAELRLVNDHFYLRPISIANRGAQELDDAAIFTAFSLDFPTQELGLPGQVSLVSVGGGSLYFQVKERNVTVHISQLFAPLHMQQEQT